MNMKTILAATLVAFALPAFAENQTAPALSAVEALFGSQDPIAPLSAANEILEHAKVRCGGLGTAHKQCQHAAALEAAIFAAETDAMVGIATAWAEARVAEAETAAFRAFTARDVAALEAAKAANALALEEGRVILAEDHATAIAALELKVGAAKTDEVLFQADLMAREMLIDALRGLAAEQGRSAEETEALFKTAATRFLGVCQDGQQDAPGQCTIGTADISAMSIQEVIDLLAAE